MIPSLQFVKQTFQRYNTEIFGDILPEPVYRLTKASTFRGKLTYKIRKTGNKTETCDYGMRISICFDLHQEEWEDVVIHEMIHLYIAFKGIKDTSSHGPEFRKMMQFINSRFNRHIKVSVKRKENESKDERVRAHFICMAKFSDGRLGIAPVAKTRIFSLWDTFGRFPGVVSIRWIGTTDKWFNSFPHIQSPKLFLAKEDELRQHMKGARPLERRGNVIKVVSRQCTPDELLP